MTNQKKFIYLILVLIFVSGIIFYLRGYLNKKFTQTIIEDKKESQTVVLAEMYPPGITAEWILEPGANVISRSSSNSNATSGTVQGTLIYESKLAQKTAAIEYEKFLINMGWATTLVENKQAKIFTINATKDAGRAYILVDQNDLSKKVTIDVTVVQNLSSTIPAN